MKIKLKQNILDCIGLLEWYDDAHGRDATLDNVYAKLVEFAAQNKLFNVETRR